MRIPPELLSNRFGSEFDVDKKERLIGLHCVTNVRINPDLQKYVCPCHFWGIRATLLFYGTQKRIFECKNDGQDLCANGNACRRSWPG